MSHKNYAMPYTDIQTAREAFAIIFANEYRFSDNSRFRDNHRALRSLYRDIAANYKFKLPREDAPTLMLALSLAVSVVNDIQDNGEDFLPYDGMLIEKLEALHSDIARYFKI